MSTHPCPCGYLGHPSRGCVCAPGEVARYRRRLSGPLLDRIDLHVEVPPLSFGELTGTAEGESSQHVRERVLEARQRQAERLHKGPVVSNGRLGTNQVLTLCRPGGEGERLLETAMTRFGLSARACHKILKVARTIADLAGCKKIETEHVAEAIQYRKLDRSVLV